MENRELKEIKKQRDFFDTDFTDGHGLENNSYLAFPLTNGKELVGILVKTTNNW